MHTLIKNRYRIEQLIGQGGMGAVYKAYDRLTTHTVALKQVTVPRKQLDILTRASETANGKMILANEFRTLASLRHPNIISVLDYGFNDEGNPFFTMDLLEDGVQIRNAAVDKTREQKIDYLLGILQALRYLHQRGILHRDLKPGNILVSDGKPKLLDFGLAVDAAYAKEQGGAAGTLAYLAPEVLRGAAPSVESDLYAFGVVAYEIFTGEHPFPYETQSELIQQVLLEVPRFMDHDLDDDVQPVILRLLSKSADDRYASALDTMRALCEAANYPLPPETIEIRDSFLIASTFVGRETELKTLKEALDKTIGKAGQSYLIAGESGVGKTRLMDELRAQALVKGMIVMRGQAVTEAGLPYKLWRDILPNLLFLANVSDEEAAILAKLVPNIADLLERPISPTDLSESAINTRLPFIITNLISEASQTTAILIMLEDLQWASDSIDILKQVVSSIEQQSVMILGNYRSDEAPYLLNDLNMMNHITLERLTEANIKQLSAAMLGEKGDSYGVVDLIQRESEGNAFFIVEVVRALAEEVGQLSNIGQATLPAQVFAGGIQKIIQRRMSKLPSWALYPIQLSSIIGRQINTDLVQAIHSELDMNKWLAVCSEVAIFSAIGKDWQFTHDKIREYVIANLETEQLKSIHLKIAQSIETIYANDLDNYAPVLAQHYRVSEKIEKEAHYAMRAAEVLKEFNPLESFQFTNRAMLLKAYDYTDKPQYKLAELQLQLGHLALKLGKYDVARQALDTARDKFKELEDEVGIAKTMNSLGELGFMTSKFEEAIPFLEQSIPILEKHEEWLQVAYANMNMAAIQNRLSNTEKAREHNEKCYEIARRLNDELLIAKALNNMAIIHDIGGDWDKALEIHNQALEIRRRIKDRGGIAFSLTNMGAIEGDKGNYTIQKDYLIEALSHIRSVSNPRVEANILNSLGKAENNLKNHEMALTYFNEALTISEKINEVFMVCQNLLALGDYYQEQDISRALNYYYQVVKRVQEIDIQFLKLDVINSISKLLLKTDKTSALITWLCAALNLADKYKKRDEFTQQLDALRSKVETDTYESACAAGQSMTLNEILTSILEKRRIENDI